MSENKKQSFLHGTALLAIAAAVVKLIGALYKIPLNSIIGEQGFGYFNTAYEIYSVLMTISIAGLPVAMSRMISEANALGHYNQVRRVYRTARAIFVTMGLGGSLLMTLFCRQLAQFQEQPNAWFAIGCLGPCILLICTMATFRGFFQGQGNMRPTANSQMMEAVCKLFVGMAAAIILLNLTGDKAYAAGGAILGVTASCVLSVIYLFCCYRKAVREIPVTNEPVTGYWQTLKNLLAISIPISIGSTGLSILGILETKIYMGRLLGIGFTQAEADTMKGVYDMTKTIFNMPLSFVSPICVSIIPTVTAYLALRDFRSARATEESALRVTGLICAPCAVGLAVMAGPVTALLGGYSGKNLALATVLMTILGITILFYAIVMVTNAMMQAHGHPTLPIINMIIGSVPKLGAVYILAGNPHIGIVGAPIGTLLGYITIMVLNLFTMRRCMGDPPAVIRHLIRPISAALIMGAFVLAAKLALERLPGLGSSRLILCIVPILVGVAVYVIAAVKLKVITREDVLLLPKGDKIADLLHL